MLGSRHGRKLAVAYQPDVGSSPVVKMQILVDKLKRIAITVYYLDHLSHGCRVAALPKDASFSSSKTHIRWYLY